MIPLRVALLTTFVAPYRLRFFESLSSGFSSLRIFISTRVESNRQWAVEWGKLDVYLQKTLTLKRKWSGSSGFEEILDLHLPLFTIFELFSFRPQLIITSEMGMRTVFVALYALINPSVKWIIWATISETTEQQRGWVRLYLRKLLLGRSHAVIINGESGARYIRAFGVPDQKLYRIPYVTHLSLPQAQSRNGKSSNISLIHVGQLTQRKNILPFMQVLMSWMSAHPDTHVSMSFVGDGPLRDQISSLSLPPNLCLHILGSVPYDELPSYYSNADILIFPTLADEWGLVVNEAMACGVPVYGSLCSQAVEELVTDDVTGWLFEPEYLEMYAALDRALLSSLDTRLQMGIAAQERVKDLTPENAANQMINVITKIAGINRDRA